MWLVSERHIYILIVLRYSIFNGPLYFLNRQKIVSIFMYFLVKNLPYLAVKNKKKFWSWIWRSFLAIFLKTDRFRYIISTLRFSLSNLNPFWFMINDVVVRILTYNFSAKIPSWRSANFFYLAIHEIIFLSTAILK